MVNWNQRVIDAIHDLDEQRITGKTLDANVVSGIIETIDFLRLHAGALEVNNTHLRDWLRCGEGMAVVPVVPTGRMLMAGHKNGGESVSCGQIWEAMIEARPENAHEPM